MAKLPDATALGYGGGQDSGRPIASFDTSAVGRGMEGFGQAAVDLGQTFRANAERERRQDDALTTARAESNFLVKKTELEGSFRPDDGDYLNWRKRYDDQIGKIRDESAGMIPEGRARELWTLKKADDIARGQVSVDGLVRARNRDAGIADTSDQLEKIRNTALNAPDEATRVQAINAGSALIERARSAGWLSDQQAQTTRQKWTVDYAKGALNLRPPEERIAALAAPVTLNDRTKNAYDYFVGKGWSPAAAAGIVGNLVGESGLRTDAVNRGDGRDGSDSIGMGQWNAERARALRSFAAARGKPVTDFETQLAFVDHELRGTEAGAGEALKGAGDARSATRAFIGFERPAGWSPASPERGHNFFGRLRNAEAILAAYGDGPAVSPSKDARLAELIPPDDRAAMRDAAEREIFQRQTREAQAWTAAAGARSEELERSLIDAAAGRTPLIQRSAIEGDPLLDEPKRNTLLRQYDSAAGDVVKLQNGLAKFQNPDGGGFNPFNKDDRDIADKIYGTLGSNPQALDAVVTRTGIIPKTAIASMRGDLVSNDPAKVGAASTLAANLMTRNPAIFNNVDGGQDLEQAGVKMTHYVERFGMTAEQAARKIAEENTPEYQAKVTARIKSENIDDMIKKKVSIDDMRGAFDTSWFPGKPNVEFGPEARMSAYTDYAELVRSNYLENGDLSLSKDLAAKQMKRVWGVSKVNGADVVMRYPPDRAPNLAGIEDPAPKIAAQAIAAIKDGTGQDVPRDKIMFAPIPGRTATPYIGGQPAPYALSWFDKNGTLQMLNPGKAFVVDADVMRKEQTDQRAKDFAFEQKRADAMAAAPTFENQLRRIGQGALNLREANRGAIADAVRERDSSEVARR